MKLGKIEKYDFNIKNKRLYMGLKELEIKGRRHVMELDTIKYLFGGKVDIRSRW